MNKILFKIIVITLLFLIAGDSLAIFDFLEPLGFDSHFLTTETESSIHLHDTKDNDHNSTDFDTCLLCPCCVSGVNMYISSFTFFTEKPFLGILASENFKLDDFSENTLFHPPRYFS